MLVFGLEFKILIIIFEYLFILVDILIIQLIHLDQSFLVLFFRFLFFRLIFGYLIIEFLHCFMIDNLIFIIQFVCFIDLVI